MEYRGIGIKLSFAHILSHKLGMNYWVFKIPERG